MNKVAPLKILDAFRDHVEEVGTDNPEAVLATFFRNAVLAAEVEGFDVTDAIGGLIFALARLMANEPGLVASLAAKDVEADVKQCIEFYQGCAPEWVTQH
jgi:hypothetical protein